MKELSVDNLIGIKELNAKDINLIFETADYFKEVINRPIKKVPTLRDVTIANLFFENSTRTKLSFEIAEKRLSADILNFSASSSSVSKGETLIDTANNILSMKVDMIVMRHPMPGAAKFLSENVNAQIINAGDGTHEHPTQALLDAYSIKEKLGNLKNKKIAIVGDIMHSRVALSNIYCLQKLGAEVSVCGPATLIPKHLNELGVKVSYNFEETIKENEVLNMLRIQKERQNETFYPSLREYSLQYQLNATILEKCNASPLILHPGPINRGVEITSELADSEHSIILNQVENGVAIRMAVLYLLSQKVRHN